MKALEIKIKATLLEEMLGMASGDPEIHETFIASKAPDAPSREEEIEALGVDGVVDKTKTIFPKLADGTPFVYDYQIKGFFKDTAGMLRRVEGTACSKVKAFKKEIDGLLFVKERKIPIMNYGSIGNCQRPLRAETPQGSRVALANSETVPAGSHMEFTIVLLNDSMRKWVVECLDYGCLRGFGQWRNSGKGNFVYDIVSEETVDFVPKRAA